MIQQLTQKVSLVKSFFITFTLNLTNIIVTAIAFKNNQFSESFPPNNKTRTNA